MVWWAGQAAEEPPVLDAAGFASEEDEDEADDEDADAAGEADEDFEGAGELLEEAPRLSLR